MNNETHANVGIPTDQEKLEATIQANLKAKGLIRDDDGVPTTPSNRQIELDQSRNEGFKRGYQQALNDMKRQLEELQSNRRKTP